jgi:hypothetical protein
MEWAYIVVGSSICFTAKEGGGLGNVKLQQEDEGGSWELVALMSMGTERQALCGERLGRSL